MKTLIRYNQTTNFSEVLIDGFCVATLDFDTDTFEAHEEMTEAQMDNYYALMVQDKNSIDTNYDVCAEQGLYTYGY